MDRPTASAARPGPLRQLLPVALVLLLCLSLSAGVLYVGARANAEQDARQYGQTLGRSTAILIQPLLLADDRISLNYLFNELNEQPRLSGLRLLDARGLPVAVAGTQEGLRQTLELARGDEALGELTLWVDPKTSWALLRQQLIEAGALALLSIAAALLTLWLSLRRPQTETEADTTTDYRDVAASVAPPAAAEATATAVPIRDEDPDALPTLQPAPEPALRTAPPATAEDTAEADAASVRVEEEEYELASEDDADDAFEPDTTAVTTDADPAQTRATDTDDAESVTALEPQLASWLREEPSGSEPPPTLMESEEPVPSSFALDEDETPAVQPAPVAASAERDDNRDLVELLRPPRGRDGMPPFTPSMQRDEDSDEAIVPDIEQVEFEDSDSPQPGSSKRKLSVVPPLGGREEEQLGLYTLEQELELMLSATDAGYLFLIDASSARSENIEEDERTQLMRPYRTLANSVAHIYGGRVEPTAEGDLRLFFDTPKADDSHGINALCSAMLFAYLYRHYNQHRIRQFKPVINLHLALVRGHHEKLDRLLEEARFLTRTTESNELISHTALTEAPDLKNTLLEGADIRREDEDKVLIIRVAKSYQGLLEKQARHLLTKLQNREQGRG
jgi:hypothetical protein